MAGRINSVPLGVKTVYDSLNVAFDIVVTGNNSGIGTAQWYNASKVLAPGETDNDRYTPNRQGDAPITLHPTVTAIDPETRRQITPMTPTTTWTEITERGERTTLTSNSNYVKNSDGSLVVKKNVPYNDMVSLECVYKWYDPRNGDEHTDSATIELKTSLAADEVWKVTIESRSQKWNPLSGMSSLFTVTAKAMEGNTDRSNEVTFKWKYLHNLGTDANPNRVEKDVDDADYPCLAYRNATQASGEGQGHATITLDMEFESEALLLVCYIYQGNPLTLIANSQEYASIAWELPRSEGMAICKNGDTARQTVPTMTFQTMVQAGGDQVSEAILRSRTRTHWFSKRDKALNDVQPVKVDRGWGYEMTMKNSDLLTSDSARVVVTPEIYILSPYKQMTFYARVSSPSGNPKTSGWLEFTNGNYVKTNDTSVQSGKAYYVDEKKRIHQVVGGTDKYIVGKVMD